MDSSFVIIISIIIIIVNIIPTLVPGGGGGEGAFKRSLGRGLSPRLSNPDPTQKWFISLPCLGQENFLYDPDLVSFDIKN